MTAPSRSGRGRARSVEAQARRQDRILLRVMAQLGPHLLAVSRAVHEKTGGRPRAALPHLRAARRAIDAALAALARKP